jgi:DNA helicase HerA-like ATPase
MRTDPTFLGDVKRVVGSKVYIELARDLPSSSPIVDGRVYRVGQIGSFVRIPLGFLNVYGIVSMVGATELQLADEEDLGPPPRGQRILEIQLLGEAYGSDAFERGLSVYPTLDDEVHIVTQRDLANIYRAAGSSQIRLGTHSASESLPATVDLDKLVTRHAAVLGSTGTGKSNSVAAILRAISGGAFPSARVVVIDPHGEYGSALKGQSRVFRIGDPDNPLIVPYWALSFDELGWFLVDRKSGTEAQQDTLLRDRLFEMRKAVVPTVKATPLGQTLDQNEITVDSPLPFSVRKLWYYFDRRERATYQDMARTIETLIAEGDAEQLVSAQFQPSGAGSAAPFKMAPPPIMAVYANKMLGRLKDRRFDFLLAPSPYDGTTQDLHELVASWIDHDDAITILDLAGVPSEIIDVVVGLLARVLFETIFWGRELPGVGKTRPLLLVFEEAHAYLPSGEARFIQGYARRSVQRILKEGRKYGVGAIVVSQRPSELDETILSQCGTFISLRLTNTTDQGRVRSTVPDELSGLTNLLPTLRTGEALILGEAIQMPSRVRIDLIEPRPNSGDPNVSQLWSQARTPVVDYGRAITAWRRQTAP